MVEDPEFPLLVKQARLYSQLKYSFMYVYIYDFGTMHRELEELSFLRTWGLVKTPCFEQLWSFPAPLHPTTAPKGTKLMNKYLM